MGYFHSPNSLTIFIIIAYRTNYIDAIGHHMGQENLEMMQEGLELSQNISDEMVSFFEDWVIDYALTIRSGHGIRYLSVDAYNQPKVVNFYEKNKFNIYKKEKNKNKLNIPMYMILKEE